MISRRSIMKALLVAPFVSSLTGLFKRKAEASVPVVARKSTFEDYIWKTYGLPRKNTLTDIRLGDCATEHLQNIYRTQYYWIPDHYKIAIRTIVEKRGATVPEPNLSVEICNECGLPCSEYITYKGREGFYCMSCNNFVAS